MTLSVAQSQLVAAVVQAPQAWSSHLRLRALHGDEVLQELRALGWLVLWDTDRQGKPLTYAAWTLTPWAAEQLGLQLIERRGKPVWPHGNLEDDVPRERQPHTRRLKFPEHVPDRRRDYLADLDDGATTKEPDLAARLLGAPVMIDKRMAKRSQKAKRKP